MNGYWQHVEAADDLRRCAWGAWIAAGVFLLLGLLYGEVPAGLVGLLLAAVGLYLRAKAYTHELAAERARWRGEAWRHYQGMGADDE